MDPALIRFLEETTRHGSHGLAYEVFHHPVNECSPQEHAHLLETSTYSPHLAKRAAWRQHSPRHIRNVRSRLALPALGYDIPQTRQPCMFWSHANLLLLLYSTICLENNDAGTAFLLELTAAFWSLFVWRLVLLGSMWGSIELRKHQQTAVKDHCYSSLVIVRVQTRGLTIRTAMCIVSLSLQSSNYFPSCFVVDQRVSASFALFFWPVLTHGKEDNLLLTYAESSDLRHNSNLPC